MMPAPRPNLSDARCTRLTISGFCPQTTVSSTAGNPGEGLQYPQHGAHAEPAAGDQDPQRFARLTWSGRGNRRKCCADRDARGDYAGGVDPVPDEVVAGAAGGSTVNIGAWLCPKGVRRVIGDDFDEGGRELPLFAGAAEQRHGKEMGSHHGERV